MLSTKNKQLSQSVAFYALLLVFAVLALMIWLLLFKIVALGAILGILFMPLYRKFQKRFRYKWLAASLTLLVIFLIIAVPVYFVGQLLFNEIVDLYKGVAAGQIVFNQKAIIASLPEDLRNVAQNFLSDLAGYLTPVAGQTIQGISSLISNVLSSIFAIFIAGFTCFYVMKDHDAMVRFTRSIIPLSEENEAVVTTRLDSAISGIIKGQLLVALLFAAVITVGFAIFGLPNPLVWGVFAALAALVPNIGGFLIVIPAVLYLLAVRNIPAAIGETIWGILAMNIIYNLIAPKMIGSRMQLHPLLFLVSILGGLKVFGIFGVLLGPIVMVIFLSLLDIYRAKFE